MRKTVFMFVFLIVGLFLLSATLDSGSSDPSESKAAAKEEAIFEKFKDAKGWIKEQQPLVESFLAENVDNIKKEIDNVVEDITAEVDELKNKPYTEM